MQRLVYHIADLIKGMMMQVEFKINYDVAYGEYIVIHPHNNNANYHTDDRQDAVDTAYAMAVELGVPKHEVKITHKRII